MCLLKIQRKSCVIISLIELMIDEQCVAPSRWEFVRLTEFVRARKKLVKPGATHYLLRYNFII